MGSNRALARRKRDLGAATCSYHYVEAIVEDKVLADQEAVHVFLRRPLVFPLLLPLAAAVADATDHAQAPKDGSTNCRSEGSEVNQCHEPGAGSGASRACTTTKVASAGSRRRTDAGSRDRIFHDHLFRSSVVRKNRSKRRRRRHRRWRGSWRT